MLLFYLRFIVLIGCFPLIKLQRLFLIGGNLIHLLLITVFSKYPMDRDDHLDHYTMLIKYFVVFE